MTVSQSGATNVYFLDDDAFEEVRPGMRRRVVQAEHVSIWFWRIHESVPQTAVHEHRDHEQVGFIAAGQVEMSVGDERVVLTPGCLYVAAPGVPHGGSIFTGDPDRDGEVWLVDVFSPPRVDYLSDRTDQAKT